jgi:Leucine-rich repeat (LRR) protein
MRLLKLNYHARLAPQFANATIEEDYLDLSHNNFAELDGTELVLGFAAIPEGVSRLYLNHVHLDKNKAAANLALALAAVRVKLTYISLANNPLDEIGTELAAIFTATPASVTSIYLHSNNLGFMKIEDLVTTIKAFPPNVPVLGLYYNNLYRLVDNRFAQAMAAIPTTVRALNLSGNNLSFLPTEALVAGLAAIPANVTSLDLSHNKLESKPTEELVKILKAIPASVTSLNLEFSNFSSKPIAELIEILRAIPATVTSLDLSYCGLENFSSADLVLFFAAIPPNITSLNLRGNNIGYDKTHNTFRSCAELTEIFKVTPPTLISLDFSWNRLESLSLDELVHVFSVIARSLAVDLRNTVTSSFITGLGARMASVVLKEKSNETAINSAMIDTLKRTGSPIHRSAGLELKVPNIDSEIPRLKSRFCGF